MSAVLGPSLYIPHSCPSLSTHTPQSDLKMTMAKKKKKTLFSLFRFLCSTHVDFRRQNRERETGKERTKFSTHTDRLRLKQMLALSSERLPLMSTAKWVTVCEQRLLNESSTITMENVLKKKKKKTQDGEDSEGDKKEALNSSTFACANACKVSGVVH